MDDIQLVDAWRSGDRHAGEALFRRHFSGVSRFFRNNFSGPVDDLVQQTFMALLEGRQRLASGANFRSYLDGWALAVREAHAR